MLLSIITINLNNAEGLRRTLRSINPLLSDQIEHIIIDGKSNDNSENVIRQEIAGNPYARILSERDTGIYNAMNKGIGLARGTYIAYINSGDEVIPEPYARYLEFISSRQCDVFYSKTKVRPLDGNPDFIHERHPDKLYRDTIPHLTCVVRKTLLEQLGGFNEVYRICADRDLMIRLNKQNARFCFYDETISIFELGGISSSYASKSENLKIDYHHGFIGPIRHQIKKWRIKLKAKNN